MISSSRGIIELKTIYKIVIVKKEPILSITYIILKNIGFIFKYDPIPPKTPVKTLSFLDRVSLLIDIPPFPLNYIISKYSY